MMVRLSVTYLVTFVCSTIVIARSESERGGLAVMFNRCPPPSPSSSQAPTKKAPKVKVAKYVINTSTVGGDSVVACSDLSRFNMEHLKLDNKTGNLGDKIKVTKLFPSKLVILAFALALLLTSTLIITILGVRQHDESDIRASFSSMRGGARLPTRALNYDLLGASIIGESLRFMHYGRDDIGRFDEKCVGDLCSKISFFFVDQQTDGTDKMLDYLIAEEASMREMFAMILMSSKCPQLPFDNSGNNFFTIWCASKQGITRTKPPLVIDIGANAGFYTLFSAAGGARVLSIDPQPHCVHYVHAGVKLSGFSDRVRVINAFAAAGDDESFGAVLLRSGCWGTFPSYDGEAFVKTYLEYFEMGGAKRIDVPFVSIVRTVQDIAVHAMGDEGILILKIDAEGVESNLIGGLDEAGILKAGIIKNFIIEVNSIALTRNYPNSTCATDLPTCYFQLFKRFKDAGYVPLLGLSPTFFPVEDILNISSSVNDWKYMDLWWALPSQ